MFDYDNNKNYRLLVTQGSELLMYDKNGKKVSGFKYKKSSNNITSKPKHFRILNKDFMIACKDGAILPLLIQREGKKVVSLDDFLRGFTFSIQDKLNA